MQKCGSKELVSEICKNNLWQKTGIECDDETFEEEISEKEIIGQECQIKEDCGRENDVCSNGKCVTLPSVIEEESEVEEINYEKSEQTTKDEEKIEEVGEDEVKEESNTEKIEEEPEQEEQTESESLTITGQAILGSIKTILTGWNVEGGSSPGPETTSNPEPENSPQTNSNPEPENPSQTNPEQNQNLENSAIQNPENYEQENKNKKEDEKNRQQKEEKDRKENDCKNRCSRECYERLIKPCVENCAWEKCGDELKCNIDEITKNCEETCNSEKNTGECEKECFEKCMKNENTWIEPEKQERKEEKGAFVVGGGCRNENAKTNAFIWFSGWGESFEQIQNLKQKYYNGGQAEWCKWELEDLQKQRAEFEKSFNYNFAVWFFEKYLANSAEDWEKSNSGIYELYWNGGVDLSRQISERMNCLGMKKIPFDYNLINFTYETEYGKIEYWEEIKTINFDDMNKKNNDSFGSSGQEIEIITPYMKVWIFPSKEFIIYETKKAMKERRFPGPEENNKETGLTEQEKEQIMQDENFMEKIKELSNKYGGSFDVVVQFKDYEKDEIVFNLYAKISEQEIIEITPMLPEEIPEQDAKIVIDFEKIYNLIQLEEKEMRGEELESPPWDKKSRQQSVKKITKEVKKIFRVIGILNSAEISTEDSKKDVNKLFRTMFKMMISGEEKNNDVGDIEDEENSEKKSIESLSGEIIYNF